MDDPAAYLVDPSEPDASISKGFANPLDLFNYLSPSAWVNDAINRLTGRDVFGWLCDTVSGDWATFYKFGDALGNLAKFHQQLGINIQQQVINLDPAWDGNAADAAYQYFSNLAAAVSGQQLPLNDIRDRYHKAALGAWQLSNQLGNILQALADKAIIAGISAAAGTLLAETGIGALVGYGASALIVADMLAEINKASIVIQTFGGIILGLFGTGMDAGSMGDGGALANYPLPAGTYMNPGV
jgi:hypothetical protein